MKLILAASILLALDMGPGAACNCAPRDQIVSLPDPRDGGEAGDSAQDAGPTCKPRQEHALSIKNEVPAAAARAATHVDLCIGSRCVALAAGEDVGPAPVVTRYLGAELNADASVSQNRAATMGLAGLGSSKLVVTGIDVGLLYLDPVVEFMPLRPEVDTFRYVVITLRNGSSNTLAVLRGKLRYGAALHQGTFADTCGGPYYAVTWEPEIKDAN